MGHKSKRAAILHRLGFGTTAISAASAAPCRGRSAAPTAAGTGAYLATSKEA